MKQRKKWCFLLAVICLLTGCGVEKLETMESEKLGDIAFTVVDKLDIPEELAGKIKEEKGSVMKRTYGDDGSLYLARGYGEQESTGYSIEVKELYETQNAICMETELHGPRKGESVIKKPTYPYIVVKIKYSEKRVVFAE